MGVHYNAFISYRHHPDDIRVAEEIHRSLERFRVPKAIRSKGKAITRIFRDKDELPITSSLTDDIYEALEHSDYLIVICSVHTKESVWVQREIETFLKTHHRSKVLTVLASGEPYDVIPEILLHEQVVDPISGALKWVDIEPLSCDWRIPRKKAMREELPRLAAALLNCGYDELRQRQRQYRMRRMAVAFSVALIASLGLSAYFLYTSIQIKKANDNLQAANEQIREANVEIQNNLDQALRNQSEYLASVSQERLEAGDRLTAIALALAALPEEAESRPYVPAAEYALSSALYSYESQISTSAVGTLTADTAVEDFQVTEDGKRAFLLDERGIITVWDTDTFQKTGLIDASAYSMTGIFTTPGGNVAFFSMDVDSAIVCYGPDGTLLWQVSDCLDAAYLDNKSILMLLQHDYSEISRILFLDPETGEEVRQPLELPVREDGAIVSQFWQNAYSSERPVALKYFLSAENIICLVDLETGEVRELARVDTSFASGGKNINAVSVIGDDCILAMVSDGSGIYNGNYQTFQVYSPAKAEIICFDTATGTVRWTSEIVTHVFSGMQTMETIPGTDWILCQSGNTFQIHDPATGRVLSECQTPTTPMTVTVEADSAWGVLENGLYYSYDFADGLCTASPLMDGTVHDAQVCGGAFLVSPLSSQVKVYRNVKDERGQLLEGDYSLGSNTRLLFGEKLILKDNDNVYLFDMRNRELCWTQPSAYSNTLLGVSEDGTELWVWNPNEDSVVIFDMEDGAQTGMEILTSLGEQATTFDADVYFADGALVYVLECEGQRVMYRVSLQTGTAETWPIPAPDSMEYGKSTGILDATDTHIWFWQNDGTVNVLTLSDGSVRQVLDNIGAKPTVLRDENSGNLVLAAGNEILMVSLQGRVFLRFSLGERKGVSLFFHGEELLVLCDDGIVYRFNDSGEQLSRTSLALYSTFSGKIEYPGSGALDISWYETEEGDLILNAFGAGNIIDCSQWQCRAFVSNMAAYIQELDELACLSGGMLYVYRPYTTLEQMAYAEEILNGFSLSQEQMKYYGVD